MSKLAKHIGCPGPCKDGPKRPVFKCGKEINLKKEPWWDDVCNMVIEMFGFHLHQAPGEAEAELARLYELRVIDIIMTDDSDVFAFGDVEVLRSIPGETMKYMYYSTATIREDPALGFGRGGFILIALMAGGDYSRGIENCGIEIAVGLARCGFGDSLYHAVCMLEDIKWTRFLNQWYMDVCDELRSNKHGYLPCRNPKLADSLNKDWIDFDVLQLYVNPTTSWSDNTQQAVDPQAVKKSWVRKEPNIKDIGEFCANRLGWRTCEVLTKNLANNLWEGVFVHMLMSNDFNYESSSRVFSDAVKSVPAIEIKIQDRVRKSGQWARITFTATNLISLLGGPVDADAIRRLPQASTEIAIWVPARYLPSNIKPFKNEAKKKASTSHSTWTKVDIAKGKGKMALSDRKRKHHD
ncbi:hypothetical protein CVT26_012577 [Gymnopilus dilepis]|uniref:XPG-I domain-containing protein n=1 Tax=Gymnopilus dilepis TaxID=231916 RepID=A0A409YPS6_9AGAR|nr:hypothetical protein CVT26_012577 [Gymnopilus dilepis]